MHRSRHVARLVLTLVISASALALAEDANEGFVPPEGLVEGWYARIDTDRGRIVVRLLPDQAPQSVAHFSALADGRLEWFDRISGRMEKGHYYDGIRIHRALAGRHFEAGDRQGTGRGAPSLFVAREGTRGPVSFDRPGRIGMTRDGGTISAVQFFVTASGEPWLSSSHPCFGEVISGLDVVENITQVKTYETDRPIEPVTIRKIRTFAVGDPPPLPEPIPYRPKPSRFSARPIPPKTEP